MIEGVSVKKLKLPRVSECSFCWSLALIFKKLKLKVATFDLRGMSLNAFKIWAHPREPVKLWKEAFCDLYVDLLLRCLGLRGELLTVAPDKHDLLDNFIHHWSGRVVDQLKTGIPVMAYGAWPSYAWGVITQWDERARLIKGLIPGHRKPITNDCWPSKLIMIGGYAVSPRPEVNLRMVLRQIENLGANRLNKSDWVSGIDAYVMWLDRINKFYTREREAHHNLAGQLSEARRQSAIFISHHCEFHTSETERMMLAAARRYNHASYSLSDAAESTGEKPFVEYLTEAMAEEEKALLLLEEILFNTE